MAARKVTRAHEEFIERHRADMTVRELAEELGLSRTTVQRVVKRLGAYAEPETAVEAAAAAPLPPECDELVLLKEHAGALRSRLARSKDSAVPGISREYRETLAKITALEGGANRDEEGEGDLIDAACVGIA